MAQALSADQLQKVLLETLSPNTEIRHSGKLRHFFPWK